MYYVYRDVTKDKLSCPLILLFALRLKQRTMWVDRVPAVAKKQNAGLTT